MTTAIAASRVLYPLDELYQRAGRPLPEARPLPGARVPEPYRSLLVHEGDMTSRLIRFHRRPVWVRLLARYQEGDAFYREVVLVRDDDQQPVEYGAIRIDLGRLGPQARHQVLQCHLPLGSILRLERIAHRSTPRAFLKVRADATIATALHTPAGTLLYGRCNVLLNGQGEPLAHVVEILPALPSRAATGGAR